jgi:hypothetical protein
MKTATGNLKSTVTFYRGHLDAHILPLLDDRQVSSLAPGSELSDAKCQAAGHSERVAVS